MARSIKDRVQTSLNRASKAIKNTDLTGGKAYNPNVAKGSAQHQAYVESLLANRQPQIVRTPQEYAKMALNGTSGRYLPASETYNALVNAGVPINANKEPVGGSGGGDSAVQLYLNELNRQRNERQAMLDEQYKQGKKNIEDAAQASNKEAYVAFMQGIKNMPQAAAMYGSGGMAQSLANKSQLNYENNRNKIAAAKLASLAELESDYRAGVLDAGDDYLTKLSALSGKSGSSGSKGTTGKVTTYQLGDTGVKAGSELAMYNQLRLMGMSQEQAEDYLIRNGVISA